ncbi:hypothetical protein CDAR_284451 [Caerostris darwini]|uniref:Uncharacterized protein n=1 Tax=Caerostris darwini TaxID=1538125 RepID=A0AAV4UJE1_9ARAC|nr:hypothetical protein CDAR_284451 [Caerostris darwini]
MSDLPSISVWPRMDFRMREEVDVKKQYMDLNSYNDSLFIDLIYSHYRKNVNTYLIANFTADANFRLLVYNGSIIVTVKKIHRHVTAFLETQKYSMHSHGPKASVYGFTAYNKELGVSDFSIIRDLWNLVSDIREIDIESHHIILRRFSPMSLSCLCLDVIRSNNIKPKYPKIVLERLGLTELY